MLLTRWAVMAAKEMHIKSKKECWKFFEKTGKKNSNSVVGCLIDITGANDFKIHPEGFHADYSKSLAPPRQPAVDPAVRVSIKNLISRPGTSSSSSSSCSLSSSLSSSSSSTSSPSSPPSSDSQDLDTSDDFFDYGSSDESEPEDSNEKDSRIVRTVEEGKICVYTS